MSLLGRYIVAACIVVMAVMAWWYPEPVLIRGELVDWGQLYERRHAPPERMLGAMALGKAFVQSVSEPLPLTEFIERSTADQSVPAGDPAWRDVFGSLDRAWGLGTDAVRFSRPSDPPFTDLDEGARYVEYRDEQGVRHMEYRFVPARDFGDYDIPERLAFPARPFWPALLAACLAAVGLCFAGGRSAGVVESSSAGRGVRWSAVLAVVFSGVVLWPFVYGVVNSGPSYASMLMGGLFLVGALVGLGLFGAQARRLRDMVEGRFVAHYTFDPAEWKAFAEWNYGQETSQKRALWLFIFVIALLVGGGFMLVMRDEASVWVFGVLMGLMAVLWVLAVALPRLTYRRDLRRTGEVYVGERCVYVNGTTHSWGTLGSRLESVHMEKKPMPHILLVYSYMMMAGRSLYFFRNYVQVRIPVPQNEVESGAAVVKALEKSAHAG